MSFDYINDLFGRFRRGKKTKFTDVEQRAISVMKGYYNGKIMKDDFANQMSTISKEFNDLMFDGETNSYVFDENTPGWLNMFLGNKFLRWYKVWQVMASARQKPEMMSDPRWPDLEQMEKDEESALMRAIEYCLEEYHK